MIAFDSKTGGLLAVEIFTRILLKYNEIEPLLYLMVQEWFTKLSEDDLESPLTQACYALDKNSELAH